MTKVLKRTFSIFFILIVLITAVCAIPVYANEPNVYKANGKTFSTDNSSAGMKQNLENMFSSDIWSGAHIERGTEFAAPFVRVIMVIAVAIVTIVCFLFFFVTALDLAYITVPIMRPLLMKGKDGMAEKSGAKFVCISDSAIEAVNGGSSGGLGGGGDRSVGSCLTKYISSRTVEFAAFIVFCMLFFTGMLSKVVVAIFNIMYGIITAIMNIAGS